MVEQYAQSSTYSVARADAYERSAFIRRTYGHLALALLAFIVLEYALLQAPFTPGLVSDMTRGYSWLIVMGLFMFVSYIADRWAQNATSLGMQYAGLALYVVAESVIFLPLLFVAAKFGGTTVIPAAAVSTGAVFVGLTATVFITRKDFSFLAPILTIGFCVALGVIICSILFGFQLGTLFAGLLAIFAAGSILYSTSAVMNRYRTDQHVAAALSLFAGVALLFYYIVMLFMNRD